MKKLMFAVAAVAAMVAVAEQVVDSNIAGFMQVIKGADKFLNGVSFYPISGAEGFNLSDLVPYDGDKITNTPFEMWWWNNDSSKGDLGNNKAIWNSFYYIGENEYPIRPGDEGLVEDGYVWLDESDPSTWVWTDEKDADFPIRYTDKVFKMGEGFFTQPTCANPKLTIAGGVLQPVGNEPYYPVAFDADKTMLANPFPVAVNLDKLIPFDGDKITNTPFEMWWWNNDKDKGDLGNNKTIWNSFYYIGENEYPIRPGDEGLVEDGYVWLDEGDPSTWVWTDEKNADFPIRYTDKVFEAGEGFFSQPTCVAPVLKFPNPFYKAN